MSKAKSRAKAKGRKATLEPLKERKATFRAVLLLFAWNNYHLSDLDQARVEKVIALLAAAAGEKWPEEDEVEEEEEDLG